MEAAAIVNIIEVWMKVVILYCIKSVFAAVHMQSSLCFQGKWTLLILSFESSELRCRRGRGHETGKGILTSSSSDKLQHGDVCLRNNFYS